MNTRVQIPADAVKVTAVTPAGCRFVPLCRLRSGNGARRAATVNEVARTTELQLGERFPSARHYANGIVADALPHVPLIARNVLRRPGRPLDPQTRTDFQFRLGHDFSRVRVHTDTKAAASARALNARAFTVGHNIVFGVAQFVPRTPTGDQLLAHELTHVIQQERLGDGTKGTIRRWGRGEHERLTKDGATGLLRHFAGFEMDERALNTLASFSAEVDVKCEELFWFGVGTIGRRIPIIGAIFGPPGEDIADYYARHRINALNHGEGGPYRLSEEDAAKENEVWQRKYETSARQRSLAIPTKFSSIRESESVKPLARDRVLSALGDALHVAQDRGAHREGADGMGHDDPSINCDNPSENTKGHIRAQRNTELVLLRAVDMLWRLLHQDYSAKHTSTFPSEATIVQRSQATSVLGLFSTADPDLKLGNPHDRYEREAEEAAERVIKVPMVQAKRQRKDVGRLGAPHATSKGDVACETQLNGVPPGASEPVGSLGKQLASDTRKLFESRFGCDFSRVRVHTDAPAAASARAFNALAFTVARNVVFAKDCFAPDTAAGERLLTHELTHVVQNERESRAGYRRLRRQPSPAATARGPAFKKRAETVPAPSTVEEPQPARERHTAEKSYWFQEQPPARKLTTPEGVEIEGRHQVAMDPRTHKIATADPSIGTFSVQFAGMDTDFEDGKPTKEMARAEKAVLNAIGNVLGDLAQLPDIPIAWGGSVSHKEAIIKAWEQRRRDKTLRARLKEPFREFSNRPLNILIATDLTVAEKISLAPLALSTRQVYVRASEYGDPSKLQAAIRIPMVALLGGEVGLGPGGEHGLKVTKMKPLTEEQSKAALLHEIVHVLLINRGASAVQLWVNLRPTMVKGPQTEKDLCEDVMFRYLRAQEELFVYTAVGELYSAFSVGKSRYQDFIDDVDLFLASISVRADQTEHFSLNVGEKVSKKKVGWALSYKYPASVTVSKSHGDQLKELQRLDRGR